MKFNKYFLIIVCILILITMGFIMKGKRPFLIKFEGDFTSSGAQRNYEATLIFKGNALLSGTETYFVGQGGGCTSDCNRTDSCKILNQKWVDSNDGSGCKIGQYIPLKLEEINQKIKNKEIKSKNECGHLDICYEITSS